MTTHWDIILVTSAITVVAVALLAAGVYFIDRNANHRDHAKDE